MSRKDKKLSLAGLPTFPTNLHSKDMINLHLNLSLLYLSTSHALLTALLETMFSKVVRRLYSILYTLFIVVFQCIELNMRRAPILKIYSGFVVTLVRGPVTDALCDLCRSIDLNHQLLRLYTDVCVEKAVRSSC